MTVRLTRRGLLAAGVGATLMQGCRSEVAEEPPLPLVQPTWSEEAARRFGVNAHPNFLQTGYRNTREWLSALARLDAGSFRGLYAPELPSNALAVATARELGLRWGMRVSTGIDEPAEIVRQRVAHIAERAADRCLYIEGLNEPNYVRGGGNPSTDWVRRTVVQQSVIWEAVRREPALADVTVLGPSLQAAVATDDDYEQLTEEGITEYFDAAAVHVYPGGHQPAHGMAERLAQVRDAWPDRPVWVTETGYTNATASDSGHPPVPEEVAGDYAPSALLEAVDRDYHVTWYELLDDPDAGEPDQTEHHFGLLATRDGAGPPWREKPAAVALRMLLGALRDPGPTYTPARVPLRVTTDTADVRWTALGKRDGTVTVYLRRAVDCWDPATARPVEVEPVEVLVSSSSGGHKVDVDHRVLPVLL